MPEPAISSDSIDADAQKVIRRLLRNGYQAYLVGGCVRDLLLLRKPKDFDVATSATPAELRDLFRNCRIIGRRFRLAHVFFGQKIIETATFRANPREVLDESGTGEGEASSPGGPEDSGELLIRHDNVFGTAEEDARRRDFTINGLFYDLEEGQVIDYVDGLADLNGRSVRTIGDPDIRFREDPVRILRAIKFAARLGFDIEDKTYRAVITHREEIAKSAPPRVLEEIYRLLRGGAAVESLVLLRETGALTVLIPELSTRLRPDPALLDPYLAATDTLVGAGETVSNAVLLCVLCAPDLQPLLDEREGERLRDPGGLIDVTLQPLLLRMRVSRRDAERAKQILLGQRRIAQLRKRSVKAASLSGKDWFQESLQLAVLHRLSRGTAPPAEVTAEFASFRRPLSFVAVSEVARPPAATSVGESLDEGRPRRRRGSGPRADGAPAPAPAPAVPGPRKADRAVTDGMPDDEPVENEEAALAAYAAVLSQSRYDE